MGTRQSKRETFYFYLFIMPWIIGFLLFTLYPVGASLFLSLTKYDGVSAPQFIGFENYKAFISDDLFWRAVKSTLYYTLLSVPLTLGISLGFALLLNQKTPFQNFFRTSLYLPSMVSGVTMALLWTWLFNPSVGLINYMLSLMGIQGPMWLTSENWAIPALIIMSFWTAGGGMVIFFAALKSVPVSYYEAAILDGANAFQRLWKITIPMISPVLLFQLIMNIIDSFQVFTPAYVMTKGGPHYATWFYVFYIFKSAFSNFNIGYSSALGWLLLLAVSILSFYIIKSSSKFVHYEGGKN